MKFHLLITPHEEEKVTAQLHQESTFSNDLKEFVLSQGNSNELHRH